MMLEVRGGMKSVAEETEGRTATYRLLETFKDLRENSEDSIAQNDGPSLIEEFEIEGFERFP